MTTLSMAEVQAAAQRLRGHVRRTPTLRCADLEPAGTELWFKCENLQDVGAFKARGALHAVGRLDPAARGKGLVSYSSGNHAQAVALAAQRYGVSATLTMPIDAPRIKVEAVRELGASIEFVGTTSSERQRAALQIAEQTGAVVIPPFDHPDIIAGAGTATLELADDVQAQANAPLDAVVVPVGGGGLIAGACLVGEALGIAVHGVEPVGVDAMTQSLAAGRLVDVEPGPTIADGLKPTRIGELNFTIARRVVAQMHAVDDAAMAHALRQTLIQAKLLVEPSAAAAVAVALRGLPDARRVGVVLSGGNIDPDRLVSILGAP